MLGAHCEYVFRGWQVGKGSIRCEFLPGTACDGHLQDTGPGEEADLALKEEFNTELSAWETWP